MNNQEQREVTLQYLRIAPQVTLKRVERRCPECGSPDYDPAHGCAIGHGKFREAA